jgi:CTP synthase
MKTLAYQIYGRAEIFERYNCNYELNPDFRSQFEAANLRVSGEGDNREVRIIELPRHRFFLATAFQPQLSSTKERPHPLFIAYLKACAEL